MTHVIDRPSVLRLNPADNVVVAMRRIEVGETVADEGVNVGASIPSGHKIAVRPIGAGEAVRKYGQVIGAATENIAAGAHVHTHNLAMSGLREEAGPRAAVQRRETPRTFEGIGAPTARSACATTSAC